MHHATADEELASIPRRQLSALHTRAADVAVVSVDRVLDSLLEERVDEVVVPVDKLTDDVELPDELLVGKELPDEVVALLLPVLEELLDTTGTPEDAELLGMLEELLKEVVVPATTEELPEDDEEPKPEVLVEPLLATDEVVK